MKRFATVIAIFFLSGSGAHGQDPGQLVEEMKKMQTQITALQARADTLERTVTVLRAQVEDLKGTSSALNTSLTKLTERVDKINGFVETGSGFIFNSPGPLTIRGGSLNFESTGPLLVKGGTTTVHGTSSLTLVSNAGTSITSGTQLEINAGSTTNLTSGTALNLKTNTANVEASTLTVKAGTGNVEAPSFTVKAGTANVEATQSFKVKANGIAALESGGDFSVRGQAVLLQGNTRMHLKAVADLLLLEGQTVEVKASGDLRLRSPSIRQN